MSKLFLVVFNIFIKEGRSSYNCSIPTSVNPLVKHIFPIPNTLWLRVLQLPKTDSLKYLGATIDNSITFEDNITYITKKATGIQYMLMRSLKKTCTRTRGVGYFTRCQPILEFSSIVWRPYLRKIIDKTKVVNRRAFCWVYGFTKYSQITE